MRGNSMIFRSSNLMSLGSDAGTGCAETGSFKCSVMDTGETCNITFKEAGQFKYFCSLHPHMTGTVIVKPE